MSQRGAVFARLPRYDTSFAGRRVAYAVRGRGPAVLLLHGLGGTADFWQPVIERLGERFTLIAPDLPGFGFSDRSRGSYPLARHAGAMLAVLRAAGVRELHALVGHSAGGVVAVALCAINALPIGRVALAATPFPSPRFPVREELISAPFFGRLLDNRRLARVDHFVWQRMIWPLLRRVPMQEYLRGGWAGFMDYSADSFYDTAAELMFRTDLDPLLPALRDRPTLLLYGPADGTIPLSHGQRLAAELPASRLIELAGGHYAVLREGLRPLAEWLEADAG